jgi:hypothetical protein
MQFKHSLVSILIAASSSACDSGSIADATPTSQGAAQTLRSEHGDGSGARDDESDDEDRGDGSRRQQRRGWRSGAAGSSAPVAGRSGMHARAGAGAGADASHPPAAGSGGTSAPAPVAGKAGAGAGAPAAVAGNSAPAPGNGAQRWQPKPGSSWQYQLTGQLDAQVDAEIFDIDLFETSQAQISALHSAGRKVICYFDTAYEPGRPDSAQLTPFRGNTIDGWPDQSWVDIRQSGVLDVMRARIALAHQKGCDGIDADDVDAYDNDSGFPLTANDQRTFIAAIAAEAHAQGLAAGLKNAIDLVPGLVDQVDFAVNEECFSYDECDALKPFTAAGKPVFEVEYTNGSLESKGSQICSKANALGFETLIKKLELDATRYACR